ncbi:hydrolase [Bacillus subtilis]|uniref:Hydrolase n=1 Tax=Bacillus subtilis TaxID=1423 RepID=A0A0D1KMU1_BACIU|nr:hydrolase [Bacillus subtilis]
MNLRQLSEHVYQCEFELDVPLRIPVHTWFIKDGDDVYIVDTGIERFADAQIRAALAIGNPKAILLTHGHSDHIGGASKWLESLIFRFLRTRKN